jgi:hypothetical protein
LQPGIACSGGCSVKVDAYPASVKENAYRGNQGDAFVSVVISDDLKVFHGIEGNDSLGIIRNDRKEIIKDDLLGRYEVYIVSEDLKGDLGVALIDSGSQASLIRALAVVKFNMDKEQNFQIYGITGKPMEIKGKVNIRIKTH